MNWIETETEKKMSSDDDRATKKEKTTRNENGEIRFFVDDVSIVYCNAPNVEKEKESDTGQGRVKNKSDYCLTSETAEIKL